MEQNFLFLITGPSAIGKSLLVSKLLQRFTCLCYFRSCTTRKPRPSENEKDYIFLNDKDFTSLQEQGDFLETDEFAGHRYGTSLSELKRCFQKSQFVITEINLKGLKNIKEKNLCKGICKVFCVGMLVIDPNLLLSRLHQRNTDIVDLRVLRNKQDIAELEKLKETHVDLSVKISNLKEEQINRLPEQKGYRTVFETIENIIKDNFR